MENIPGSKAITVDLCQVGGDRKIRRRFVTNVPEIQALAARCDGKHHHPPWHGKDSNGSWRPAGPDASEYTRLLCERMAQGVRDAARRRGITSKEPEQDMGAQRALIRAQLAAGRQPRGRRLPEVIPEFIEQAVREVDTATLEGINIAPGTKTGSRLSAILRIPRGSKVTEVRSFWDGRTSVTVGVYFSQKEFAQAMSSLRHPFDEGGAVPDDILQAIFKLLTIGPEEIKRQREAKLGEYKAFKARPDIAEADRRIRERLTPQRQKIVGERSFLLFEKMCLDAGIDDPELLRLYVEGVSFTGCAPDAPELAPQSRPARMGEEEVRAAAVWTRPQAIGRTGPSDDPNMDQEVWQKTIEERNEGWLRGPMTVEDFVAEMGEDAVLSRRFGVRQSEDEARVIDDLAASYVNSAFASPLQGRS